MVSETDNQRRDDLSLHMRIPADKCYFRNALLTLDGICEHFSVGALSKERIQKVFENALSNSLDLSYKTASGLFELKFSVYRNSLEIAVESCLLGEAAASSETPNEQTVLEKMKSVVQSVDKFNYYRTSGRNVCYSMSFSFDPEG